MRSVFQFISLGFLLGLVVTLTGCQGDRTTKSPVHLNPNMDNVAYIEAQEPNPFFADGRGMRPQVAGTLTFNANAIEGTPKEHLYEGKFGGEYVSTLPAKGPEGEAMDYGLKMVERGQERYNIYCAPCHAQSGDGQGIVIMRGMVMPPSFHDDRIMAMTLGQLYHTITYGARNMKGYQSQIPVKDRWAIATYLRALQYSRNVPES